MAYVVVKAATVRVALQLGPCKRQKAFELGDVVETPAAICPILRFFASGSEAAPNDPAPSGSIPRPVRFGQTQ